MNDKRSSADASPDCVTRRYEFRLYPNAAQRAALDEQAALLARLWNAALEQREAQWRGLLAREGECRRVVYRDLIRRERRLAIVEIDRRIIPPERRGDLQSRSAGRGANSRKPEMAYEVKTPILKKVTDGLMGVFEDALAGRADREQGTMAINAGAKITRGVEVDIKARLAAPKIARIEAVDQQAAHLPAAA